MAWPPPTLPTNRTDTTVMSTTHPADHNAANLAINDIVAQLNAKPWTAVTFSNGWVNFGAGYQAVQYRKVGDMVQVRGVMKSGTLAATAFTLPAGHTPPAALEVPVTANAAYGNAVIPAAGTVSVSGSNTYVAMNFQFSVTA